MQVDFFFVSIYRGNIHFAIVCTRIYFCLELSDVKHLMITRFDTQFSYTVEKQKSPVPLYIIKGIDFPA